MIEKTEIVEIVSRKYDAVKHSPTAKRGYHRAHFVGHISYFLAVALQGHGAYALAAGGMLVIVLVGVVFDSKED